MSGDMVLVRRDDLRDLLAGDELSNAYAESHARLLAAVNGDATSKETFYRCSDGEQYPTITQAQEHIRAISDALAGIDDQAWGYTRVDLYEAWVEGPFVPVGPWTTQETP